MRSFPLLLLVLSGLLFGCSNAPLSVALRDFDVDVAAVQSNKIVFVKQSFDRPPVSLSRVELEGSLTYQTGFTFSFFASDTEPCNTRSGAYYLCDPSSKFEQIGTADFQSGSTQPLKLIGNQLTSGINSGNLWIGVRLDSGLFTSGTMQFRNMIARVALVP
ncbi:hypothetical protein [Meiothermus ruber]|jgi:hypothetical protein|uniref:Lipoprotein n=1 Tax=Meiothermus ruber (strain ATCC 35948 / DSM 1279 / VKM B-1258 / 21) TaxID=504728 RepID=D3PPB1_MEIRD|nr:hypothetical protein [Meiothermus ruber]ADD27520.1 hypothetical protein Mrub_0754 [Meiothermus ruber DSM 1279]AGK03984.1 hypothetical protein K649_03410 [Meiothermus ruber DSM 1279]MCL6530624.1 hypothetical protein [Meiothermus ruber]GAO74449.1 putative uncharacterized protein [Meiothermus ruber H328]